MLELVGIILSDAFLPHSKFNALQRLKNHRYYLFVLMIL